ncbi:MAG: ABC transporter substrate-binding protein, partial [Burkholderiales bacterium]
MSRLSTAAVALALLGFLGGCGGPWNNPYPAHERGQNTLYSAFVERPKHLDPVQSYAENEYVFIAQIYMPPLQYHYLRRPYELIPFGAAGLPRAVYLDAAGRRLPDSAPAERVAFSVYDIRIRQGVMYQPHPAFAVDESATPRYLNLGREDLKNVFELRDFRHTGTRELVAEDYVFQIRRLAHPGLHSP